MKKIKSYYNYLLESILYANDDLINLLNRIDNPISNVLLNLIGNDVKVNFNALKTSSKNDMINFIPDAKVSEKPEDWSKSKNLIKLGRLTKDILKSNGHNEFTDKDIEQFVTKYKAVYDSGDVEDKFKIVEGEEIKYWYDGDRYVNGTGTLQKSCMRYSRCQDYFNIYTENPDKCKMVILLNSEDPSLIDARALLWYPTESNRDYEIYLDRIYYTLEEQLIMLKDWVRNKFKDKKLGGYDGNMVGNIDISLTNYDFSEYPYMDTFIYLNGNTLSNHRSGDKELTNTDGSFMDEDMVYCEWNGESYPEDQVIYIDSIESYVHSDDARYSSHFDQYYLEDDVVYSSYMGDSIPKDKAVFSTIKNSYLLTDESTLVYLDIEQNNEDYFPSDELNDEFAMDEDTNDYYKIELLIKTGDGAWSLPSNVLTCYEDINDSGEYWAEIDAKLFGISINKESTEIFTKNEYFDGFYEEKIYKKQYSLTESLIKDKLNTPEDIEMAEDSLKYYKEWHDKKMITDANYSKLQNLYDVGGWNVLVSKKRKLFFDNFKRLIDKDYFIKSINSTKSNLSMDNRILTITYRDKVTDEDRSYKINLNNEITDETYSIILKSFFELVEKSFTIRKFKYVDIINELMSDLDKNERLFYTVIFSEITDVFEVDPNATMKGIAVFMYWGNEEWIRYYQISNDITNKTISIVDKELGLN